MAWTADDIGCAENEHVVIDGGGLVRVQAQPVCKASLTCRALKSQVDALGGGDNTIRLGDAADQGIEITQCQDDVGAVYEAVQYSGGDYTEAVRCCADATVGTLCTMTAPHGSSPAPPLPPIPAECGLRWSSDAHSSCAPGGSCAPCESCFTTPRVGHPGFCGCFETDRGGPECSGAFARCPPCESCAHCVTTTDGSAPPGPQACGPGSGGRGGRGLKCPKGSRCEHQEFRQIP